LLTAIEMSMDDYKRMYAEIQNLQLLIRERKGKREPFMSSLADALENTVKKSREWFSEEVKMALRQIGILEQIDQYQDFDEEKLNLKTYKLQFDNVTSHFDQIIKSIRDGQLHSLKDLTKKGLFQVDIPELSGDFSKLFDVCINLENLLDGLENGAKYIISAQRVVEITLKSHK
jgi:hypothetical protein